MNDTTSDRGLGEALFWLSTEDRLDFLLHLLDAIEALEDPHRLAVLLCFRDGLDPEEVARREGLRAETVRERRDEALARLRARLDVAYGGERDRWASIAPRRIRP